MAQNQDLLKLCCEQLKQSLEQSEMTCYSLGRRAEHAFEANCLVELLEIFDCGSTGGYGQGQQDACNEDYNPTLQDRVAWLLNKYDSE